MSPQDSLIVFSGALGVVYWSLESIINGWHLDTLAVVEEDETLYSEKGEPVLRHVISRKVLRR